jgi:hypothetical protein
VSHIANVGGLHGRVEKNQHGKTRRHIVDGFQAGGIYRRARDIFIGAGAVCGTVGRVILASGRITHGLASHILDGQPGCK